MANDDEHGSEAVVGLEAEPYGGRVGDGDVLNPADERDVAGVPEDVDVLVGHGEVQPKGVMSAHGGAA